MNWQETLIALEKGIVRSATKVDGVWQANVEVKKAILEAFKNGTNANQDQFGWPGFVDKHNIPARKFTTDP